MWLQRKLIWKCDFILSSTHSHRTNTPGIHLHLVPNSIVDWLDQVKFKFRFSFTYRFLAIYENSFVIMLREVRMVFCSVWHVSILITKVSAAFRWINLVVSYLFLLIGIWKDSDWNMSIYICFHCNMIDWLNHNGFWNEHRVFVWSLLSSGYSNVIPNWDFWDVQQWNQEFRSKIWTEKGKMSQEMWVIGISIKIKTLQNFVQKFNGIPQF
jgi:hypothetical protein